jgi:hypothetical protein
MQSMKQCGDMAMKMMPSVAAAASESGGSHHVCDDIK